MSKQARSLPVMRTVLEAVAERLMEGDETLIRIPEICEATGVNYGSVYHHFGSREGVIDAAYQMVFSELLQRDNETMRQASQSARTREEYVMNLTPLLAAMATGDTRRQRRAMRARIVAAATTRPALRRMIGEVQRDRTNELATIMRYGQDHGWIRADLDAHFIAVLLQAVIFGRTLDDISAEPIDDDLWANSVSVLAVVLLSPENP